MAVFSVPLHKELKKGTLIAILKQADIRLRNSKNFSIDLIIKNLTEDFVAASEVDDQGSLISQFLGSNLILQVV